MCRIFSTTKGRISDFFHFIPKSPHYFQIARLLRIDFNFFSDMTDVNRNCVIRCNCFFLPDAFINLISRKNASLIFYQQKKYSVFNRCQLYDFSINCDLFSVIIDHQPAGLINVAPFFCCCPKLGVSAKLGFHSCHQFQRIKRFRHIIICSYI